MTDESASDKYFGIYQGTVMFNADPMFSGRLMLSVPDVLSYSPSTWAEPCTPLAGPTGPPMGVYMVPPPGTGVWVMFDKGDVNKPVWLGCRWGGPSDIPPLALTNPPDPNIVIQSLLQNMIMVSDLPPTPVTGGIMLKSTTGAMIVVNDSGIYISNGKGATITMIGPTINFNLGAMTIT